MYVVCRAQFKVRTVGPEESAFRPISRVLDRSSHSFHLTPESCRSSFTLSVRVYALRDAVSSCHSRSLREEKNSSPSEMNRPESVVV